MRLSELRQLKRQLEYERKVLAKAERRLRSPSEPQPTGWIDDVAARARREIARIEALLWGANQPEIPRGEPARKRRGTETVVDERFC